MVSCYLQLNCNDGFNANAGKVKKLSIHSINNTCCDIFNLFLMKIKNNKQKHKSNCNKINICNIENFLLGVVCFLRPLTSSRRYI